MAARNAACVGLGWVTAGLLLVGCPAGRTASPDGPGSSGAAGESSEGKPGPARHGVAHLAGIDRVAIASDGTAALTRDTLGGARLWPALDGSEEPMLVPERSVQAFSVARHAKGWTVVVIDASGGAKFLRASPDGSFTELGALAPFDALLEVHVISGGERVIALYRDHTIRLLNDRAKELARFEDRKFRPTQLRVSADGKVALAVVRDSGLTRGLFTGEVHRIAISKAAKLSRMRSPRLFESVLEPTPRTLVMSPDGKRLATIVKNTDGSAQTPWQVRVLDLERPGKGVVRGLPTPAHVSPSIGFVKNRELIATTNDGNLSWLVELHDGASHPRTAPPQNFQTQGLAQANAAGIQLIGHGTWLFVHEVDEHRHRFLGYELFQPQSVAISPSGEWIAWGYGQGQIYVEPMAEGDGATKVHPQNPIGMVRVLFVDEDHLLALDGVGGIRLVHWPSGKTLAHAGVGSFFRAAEYEQDTGLLRVDRTNNDVRLFEVSVRDGFAGPYIISDDSFRSGLLAKTAKGMDAAVLWTVDGKNMFRTYTLADLRIDLSRKQLLDRGKKLPSGTTAPLAIDRHGTHYTVQWKGNAMELVVDRDGKKSIRKEPAADVTAAFPGPLGKRFILVHQKGQVSSITVHDARTLKQLWSYSTGVVNNQVVWSPDGLHVALAANTGGVVLDGGTGQAAQSRCGLEFESRGSPPNTALSAQTLRSLCEQ